MINKTSRQNTGGRVEATTTAGSLTDPTGRTPRHVNELSRPFPRQRLLVVHLTISPRQSRRPIGVVPDRHEQRGLGRFVQEERVYPRAV